jgi:hypothetical protein
MASMSILDDAIREHLELKRAHGADESEVKKLEDEAFGPPQRPDEPDPFAEAPTEFIAAPDLPEGEAGAAESDDDSGRRRINVADLQEAPPATPAEGEAPEAAPDGPDAEAPEPEPAVAEAAEVGEPEAEAPSDLGPESASEQPIESAGPSTEERHAIAEQPTQFFDVEAEMDADAPPVEAPSPSDEEILDEELTEPRLDSVDAPTELHPVPAQPEPADSDEEPIPAAAAFEPEDDEEGDDDFWNDQRLSDELDQALEAPNAGEHAVPGFTDEHEVVETGEHEVGADTGEYEVAEYTEEHEIPSAGTEEHRAPAASQTEEEDSGEIAREPGSGSEDDPEDVLEDTPEFLEDAPEDDELWFEQRPPKDFDFDD